MHARKHVDTRAYTHVDTRVYMHVYAHACALGLRGIRLAVAYT